MTTMTYEQEKESLARVLRDKIFSYKAARPNLSSAQIASKFGMSNSTFSRLENLDIKNPTFDQVVKIFNGVGDQKGLLKFIKDKYPEISIMYRSVYNLEREAKFYRDLTSDYFVDERTHKLMLLAASNNGVCEQVIKEELGRDGLRHLDLLIKEDVIEKRGEKYFVKDDGFLLTQEHSRDILLASIRNCYDLHGFNEKTAENWLSYQAESVNLSKVMPKVMSLIKELNQRVRELFNDPENAGEEVMWVGLASDTVLENNLLERYLKEKGKIQ